MALTRNVGCCVSIRDCIGDQESEVDIAAMVVCKNDVARRTKENRRNRSWSLYGRVESSRASRRSNRFSFAFIAERRRQRP
jgi:hypothetical protein